MVYFILTREIYKSYYEQKGTLQGTVPMNYRSIQIHTNES